MKKMLITTTSNISDPNIKEYLGPVSTHIVLGTNLFSDIAASVSDMFGGESSVYSEKLKMIYSHVVERISKEASYIGADAIIGLQIDFSEISGKGKGMLMASAIGTAVRLIRNGDTDLKIGKYVSGNFVVNELAKKEIFEKMRRNMYLVNDIEWRIVTDQHSIEWDESVIEQCIHSSETILDENVINFLHMGDFDSICKKLYENVASNENVGMMKDTIGSRTLKIIHEGGFFNPKLIVSMLASSDLEVIAKIIDIKKEVYDTEDVVYMDQIADYLTSLPDKGQIIDKKSMLGKEKQVYVCPEGHKNDIEDKFCCSGGCGLNIKGLTAIQVKAIDDFNYEIKVIKEAMER